MKENHENTVKIPHGFYADYGKRFLDIVLSLCGLIVLLPLMLVLALVVRLDSPGPILFKQKRVTKGKRYFNILKFRTMSIDTPPNLPTHLLEDPNQWITRAGWFLRSTSLDELPQIWNILVGDMSIVGPRPALWNQFDLVEARDKCGANEIRPGLTGWAQINGRDALTNEIKSWYDGEYVQKLSFWFDVRCFVGTFLPVLRRDGVIEGGVPEPKENEKEPRQNEQK